MSNVKIQSRLIKEFWDWCSEHNCSPIYRGTIFDDIEYDIWYISDNHIYTLALLVWS